MTDKPIPTAADVTGEACPVPATAEAPADDVMATALGNARSVAVVGASPNADRTSHQIALWLMENTPYQVYLVNPAAGAAEIRGHGFYESLADLPTTPDIVDVFRRAEHVPALAEEAVAVGAGMLWMQLGVTSDEGARIADAGGLTVVQNRCLKVEYARLRTQIAT